MQVRLAGFRENLEEIHVAQLRQLVNRTGASIIWLRNIGSILHQPVQKRGIAANASESEWTLALHVFGLDVRTARH